MIKLIIPFIVLLLMTPIALSLPDKIFVLELTVFSDDNTTLQNFKIAEGVPDRIIQGQANEEYTLQILSSSDQVLFQRKLPIFFVGFPDEEIAEGSPNITIVSDKVDLFLKLPYFEEAKKIEIYHLDKKIFDFGIPEEKKTICGNNICETGETTSNCSQDCKEAPKPSETSFIVYIVFLVVIVAIVILFLKKLRIQK